jgi:hypothetical protein
LMHIFFSFSLNHIAHVAEKFMLIVNMITTVPVVPGI